MKRKTTGNIADTARATIEPAARLTAALVSFLDGDHTKTTAAELYAVEVIADHLRRALTRPNAINAICSLTGTAINADDRQAIDLFLQQTKQR